MAEELCDAVFQRLARLRLPGTPKEAKRRGVVDLLALLKGEGLGATDAAPPPELWQASSDGTAHGLLAAVLVGAPLAQEALALPHASGGTSGSSHTNKGGNGSGGRVGSGSEEASAPLPPWRAGGGDWHPLGGLAHRAQSRSSLDPDTVLPPAWTTRIWRRWRTRHQGWLGSTSSTSQLIS